MRGCMGLQSAELLEHLRRGIRTDPGNGEAGCSLDLEAGEHCDHVQASPHKESFAELNLVREGYRPFVPRVVKTLRPAQQAKSISAVFFPRYLFAILDPAAQRRRTIPSSFDVASLIIEDGQPERGSDGVVELSIKVTNEADLLDFREVVVGQKVSLLTGAIADLTGTLTRLDGHGRVAVLSNIMGGDRLIPPKDRRYSRQTDIHGSGGSGQAS